MSTETGHRPLAVPASPSELAPGMSARAPAIDIAIVSNAETPYRTHLHCRIVDELPEVRLWSVFTHGVSNAPWASHAPEKIRPVQFGPGEPCDLQSKPSRALHEWRKGGRIIRWIKQHNARAVVLLGYNDPGRLRIIRWCHRHGVPCLLWGDSNIHGDASTGRKARLKRAILPRILSRCRAVLPCGTVGKAYFARYGVSPERMFFFPVEPDYALIQRLSSEQIAEARTRFGLREDRRRIVYSGRLVPEKRVDLLIDAFATFAAERPDWDLLIIGDGPLGASLQSRLPRALKHRVSWTGFLGSQHDVSALYRAADVLVLPSTFEPWALVINEAAAAGLAIVSSSVVGAAAELVRDGVNGRLVPPGDATALTDALRDVTTPGTTERMKAASRDVLADWQRRGDPVRGLRDALGYCGVLAGHQ